MKKNTEIAEIINSRLLHKAFQVAGKSLSSGYLNLLRMEVESEEAKECAFSFRDNYLEQIQREVISFLREKRKINYHEIS